MRVKNGEPLAHALRIAASKVGDACLMWPYAKNSVGYGVVTKDGKKALAHRVICEAAHGPAPFDGAVVRHTCGNGADGCVNPAHLQWGSVKDNKNDELTHGTRVRGERHSRARLTVQDIIAIRSCVGSISQSEMAKAYRVSRATIGSIVQGRNWAWLE